MTKKNLKIFLIMKYLYKISLLFFLNFTLFCDGSYGETQQISDSSIKINLEDELKKGNFLIGLKQYLGAKNKNNPNNKNLLFESEDYLKLNSTNGISHRSKSIQISWEKLPLQKVKIIERLVLGPFASYESAKRKSDLLNLVGFAPIIVYPDQWELWLPINASAAKKYNFQPKKFVYKSLNTPFLTNEFVNQKLEGVISISSKKNIKINNVAFGKYFYLVKDSYGTWSLIQRLSFDKYLEGVLPHEIGANSPLEALKAQAIIARTWALYNSDRFKNDKYHLCITTQCQVYKPYFKTNESIKKAISQTNGLILTSDNKPINAFYHASNGGIIASSSESWQMRDYSYFQPKFDLINSNNNGMILPFKDSLQIENFLKNKKINFLGNNHYLFRWEKTISSSEINNLLVKNKLVINAKKISNIKVIERGFSGRVTKLAIFRDKESKPLVLIKDDIRRYLRFLPSNLFIIDKLNDNFWIFKGGGFGHGVGLSQSGAIEMAKLGFNYKDILNHYYSKIEINNIYDLAK